MYVVVFDQNITLPLTQASQKVGPGPQQAVAKRIDR
jgi:cephalosporin hydroxylase